MNVLQKLADFAGGSLFKEISTTIKDYFPPSMSDKEKAEMQLKVDRLLIEKRSQVRNEINAASRALDKRIAEQEGTAKDLLAMPVIGRVVLFLRGIQRPVWGFSTLYINYLWFSGGVEMTEQQGSALFVINMIVLVFLFGERTIKNLEPVISKVFAK